jgi:hypothetical protein
VALICPTCSRRAEATARYCRDCYTVFSSNARTPAKQQQAQASAVWKFLPLVLIAAGAAWFVPIDTSPAPTSAPDDPFAKTPATGLASSSSPSPSSSPTIAAATATRTAEPSSAGNSSNTGFGKTGGSLIGGGRCASGLTNEVGSCLDVISGAGDGSVRGSKGSGPQWAEAGETAALVLPPDADLPCPPDRACPVVVRFSSGETATYIARGRGSSRTLVPADGKAEALLKKHGEANVQIRTRSGEVRAVPVRKTGISEAP